MDPPSFSPPTCFTRIIDLDRDQSPHSDWRFNCSVSARGARKRAAKHATSKKAKSKVRRAGGGAPKSAAKKKRPPKTATRKTPKHVVEVPVEDTIIDVIEEPVPRRGCRYRIRIEFGPLLPFCPAVSPSAASVPRRKNNKSILFVVHESAGGAWHR